MRCPVCDIDDDKVLDSRSSDDGVSIRRRRECNKCKNRFTTYERIEGEARLFVIKRNGSREVFDRQKVMRGIIMACRKRPVPSTAMESVCSEINQELLQDGIVEIEVDKIGELVMEKLKDIDPVAYVRFASVYRQFKDINDFMDELKRF